MQALRSFDFWANLLAITLLLLIGAISIMNMDPVEESQTYHLPVTARLAGIVSKDGYRMDGIKEGYFAGMPKLGELVQGLFWRITGLPGAANLVGLISLAILIVVSSTLLQIPLWQLTLFFLSIPLVFRHSYSAYVDLAANALFALALMLFFHTLMNKQYTLKRLIGILAPLAISANISIYSLLLSAVLGVIVFFVFFINRIKFETHLKQVLLFLLVFLVFIGAAYWSLGVNTLRHDNPLYPMAFSLGDHHFIGSISASTPVYITDTFSIPKSNSYYFMRSLSEIDLWRVRPQPMFTIDMNLGEVHPILNARMGGFFVLNLLLWGMGLLIFSLFSQNRAILKCVFIVIVLSVAASFLPSASELRHVMFIPLSMATLFLIGLYDPARKRWSKKAALILQALIFVFVAYQVVVSDHFPKIMTIQQYREQVTAQHELFTVDMESPVCLYGESPVAFSYKLANPDLVIEAQPTQSDCSYSNQIDLKELKE